MDETRPFWLARQYTESSGTLQTPADPEKVSIVMTLPCFLVLGFQSLVLGPWLLPPSLPSPYLPSLHPFRKDGNGVGREEYEFRAGEKGGGMGQGRRASG